MPLFEEAIKELEASDLKITKRRIRMLELLYEEDRYMSAKEVKEKIEIDFPGISPDTIYRNLHSFSTLEILEETELDGEKVFRSNCGVDEHHHHFICTNCGYSKEITVCPLSFYQEELAEFEVNSHRFELFGLCQDCKKDSKVNQ